MANYVICTCQRSGKTWLTRALEKIRAGHAAEYVTMLHRGHPLFQGAWRAGGIAEFWRRAADSQKGTRHAGICLHWNDFQALANITGKEPSSIFADLVDAMGPNTKIMLLRRRDVLAQAVSHYLMSQTGHAHSFQPDAGDSKDVPFDREKIRHFVGFTHDANENWAAILQNHGFLQIIYEDFSAEPIETFRSIIGYIGAGPIDEADIRSALERTRRMPDRNKSELIRRYLQTE